MTKLLSKLGIALCLAGILLGAISVFAHFSPPNDPTGAGALYDERVEAYNHQVKQLADVNPKVPTPHAAKTRSQAHNEDTLFGTCVGGVMISMGLILWYFNRVAPEAKAGIEHLGSAQGHR